MLVLLIKDLSTDEMIPLGQFILWFFVLLVVLPLSLILPWYLKLPLNLWVPRSSPASGEGREAFDVVGSWSQEKFKSSHPSNFERWGTLNFKPSSSQLQEAISSQSALAR
jgi:hypothetical protein